MKQKDFLPWESGWAFVNSRASWGDGEEPNSESSGEMTQGMSEDAHLEMCVACNTCPSGKKWWDKKDAQHLS